MKKPTISLLMINFNRERYIYDAIKSVTSQTDSNWELIIIDDGSSDNSINIINKFLKDDRINLLKNKKNKGIVYSRKKSIEMARADIVGIIDSDDILAPNAVESIINTYKNTNSGLIYSQMMICNEDMTPISIGSNYHLGENGNNLIQNKISHFVTFKKSSYHRTNGYSKKFNKCAEDKDLFYKLEEVTNPVFINKILYYYRMNTSSVSSYGFNKIRGKMLHLLAKYEAYNRRKKNNSPKKIKFKQIFPWFNKQSK